MLKKITVNIPKNYEDKDLNIFNHDLAYDLDANLVTKSIKYGFVCPNGLVFNKFLNVVPESILLEAKKNNIPNRKYMLGEFFHKKIKFAKGNTPYIIAFSTWSINYFHWFTDTLTRLLLLNDDEVKKSVIVIPTNFNTPVFKESLSILGFNLIKTIELDEVWFAKDIIVPPYTAATGYFHPQMIKSLSLKFRDFKVDDLGFPKRIYISRKKADKRKILNEDSLLPLLENEGFASVCFEDFSLHEQIAIMRNCTHLISIHGAGLTNMLFMPKGANVLEIRKTGEKDLNCYFLMASALDLNYYYLQSEPASSEDNYTHIANLNVGVEEFSVLLKEFSSK
jgi:capsular polysaccharide biosynthesis protein